MKSTTGLPDLRDWVDQMMRDRNIADYKTDVFGNSAKGEGYLGNITYVKVNAIICNTKKCFNLVVKTATNNEFREVAPIRLAFEREIYMYTKILPMMYEFQLEKNIQNPLDIYPECYSVHFEDRKEGLILQNVKLLGYESGDLKIPHDLNHVILVMKNFAKFHAVSFALKLQKPGTFESVTRDMTDVLGLTIEKANWLNVKKINFLFGLNALKKSEGADSDIVKKFAGFDDDAVVNAVTKLKDLNHRQSVVIHGDGWKGNTMFKYENGIRSNPTHLMLIDYQLACMGSPIFDLTQYLYSTADENIIQNFDFILETYYSTLADYMRRLGSDPDEIFTFKDLLDHWKKYGRFGLVMCPFVLRLTFCEPEEVVDFVEGWKDNSLFHRKLRSHREYENRVRIIFKHFAERFL